MNSLDRQLVTTVLIGVRLDMRLASYRRRGSGAIGYGSVEGEVLRDLTGWRNCPTLAAILDGDLVSALARETGGAAIPLDEVELTAPISGRRAAFCVGVNYADRDAEYTDATPRASYPSLFLRMPESFTGPDWPLERPRASEQLDYEGEIVVVIGRGGRHIPEKAALEHVAGLTLANEGSVRDWLRHSKFNVTQGKNFDRSGSVGPWIVTADELDPARSLRLSTRVNGELRQDDTTDRMMFPFARLISYFSTFATLRPGDLILTGTPTGAGARLDPPRWLEPGDVVEVSVAEIGVLRNTVVDEAAEGAA